MWGIHGHQRHGILPGRSHQIASGPLIVYQRGRVQTIEQQGLCPKAWCVSGFLDELPARRNAISIGYKHSRLVRRECASQELARELD
jgi:hypothetical protein